MSSIKINSARGFLRISRYLFLSLGLLLAILVIQRIEGGSFSEAQIEKRTLRKIDKISAKLDKDIEGIQQKLEDSGFNSQVIQYDAFFEEITDRHDYSIFVFLQDSLVYWTNNSVPVEPGFSSNGFEEGLFFCSNTWGLCNTELKGDYQIVGFIHLQRSYPYENDFLSNEYILGSGITSAYKITKGEGEDLIDIRSDNGEVLFSLEPDRANSQAYTGRSVTLFILSLLLVLSVLMLLQDLVVWGSKRKMTNWWLLGMAADLVLIRWLMIKFELPGPIYESAFFQPFENGISFFNSQGDLLVSAVFILVFGYLH